MRKFLYVVPVDLQAASKRAPPSELGRRPLFFAQNPQLLSNPEARGDRFCGRGRQCERGARFAAWLPRHSGARSAGPCRFRRAAFAACRPWRPCKVPPSGRRRRPLCSSRAAPAQMRPPPTATSTACGTTTGGTPHSNPMSARCSARSASSTIPSVRLHTGPTHRSTG